jgi:hypothetical protein
MAPATSTTEAIGSTSNIARSQQENSAATPFYSNCREMGYAVALGGTGQRRNHNPGKGFNIFNTNAETRETELMYVLADIACSHASNWADEELKKRKYGSTDARDATKLDVLRTANNKGEKLAIEAGRKHGMAEILAFNNAWGAAEENL